MDKYAVDYLRQEVIEVYDDADEEVMDKAASHMKVGLKYQMSPITLNMKSGPHSRERKEKG